MNNALHKKSTQMRSTVKIMCHTDSIHVNTSKE